MVNAFQNVITITKGDDAQIVIDVTDLLGNKYVVKTGDVFTFYVKEVSETTSIEDTVAAISKTFNNATMSLELTSSETGSLSESKNYKYGIKLVTSGGKKQTVVVPTSFVVEGGIA